MTKITIIAEQGDNEIEEITSALSREGYSLVVYSASDVLKLGSFPLEEFNAQDAIVIELDGFQGVYDWIRRYKSEYSRPVIGLVSQFGLSSVVLIKEIDDFAVRPFKPRELVARVKRSLYNYYKQESENIIRQGELIIDSTRGEVTVGPRPVLLAYREYKLLKFMVANAGRVFSRDALLDRVWGQDYIGGDRTVDVHIRRLRSKLEDGEHTYFETVRNLGYRFKKPR
ncbi:winged helix-turn-helix domain-containing protein [Chloroflexota bacterium]